MSKQLECINDETADWIDRQHVFFVATTPLSAGGHMNCSPKGGDCFRVLDSMQVAYLDFIGSGAETAAHVRENGRIVLIFCAFEGKPNIVRLHGWGEVLMPGSPKFEALAALFPSNPGARALVRVSVSRVSTSCGFAVHCMEFRSDRDTLDQWSAAKGTDGLAEYRQLKNARSIDGLPALQDAPRASGHR